MNSCVDSSKKRGERDIEPKHEIVMVTVNNTVNPRTGGEYVYKVMKDELSKRSYPLHEISVPLMLEHLVSPSILPTREEDVFRLFLHFLCVFQSLLKRSNRRYLVITSAHPVFPVFGHLVYHQPKAGTGGRLGREYLSLHRRLGWDIVENEKLSPLWGLAKRSHILHLSNSFFTKSLIRRLYGLDSHVLYPPTRLSPILNHNPKGERFFGVIVARPEVPSGITLLPQIVFKLPKTARFEVIGRADATGLQVIRALKKKGFGVNYHGYISEQDKLDLFGTLSHYLHLAYDEPFGITVVEAMAAGCIPIAPASGGIPEFLPRGLLYSSLSEATEMIASKVGFGDKELQMRLRSIASKFTEEEFRIKFAAYVRALEKTLINS